MMKELSLADICENRKQETKNTAVSLLDCSLRGVTSLPSASIADLAGVGLHGLVSSSGDIKKVQQGAFNSISSTLLALGLPNNQLPLVPTEALIRLGNLERLDLSNNKIHTLDTNSFKGIQNLTYLDISDNQLTSIADATFQSLAKLAVLRLRGNLLKVSALTALKVRVCSERGASLAQLTNLVYLDLSHNFLRSLSAEPLKALHHLTELLLHDNDISMIDDGALALHKDLERFTVEDNPLNCDCLMTGFARWLREAKNLPQSDKSAAACATPPHNHRKRKRKRKYHRCPDWQHPPRASPERMKRTPKTKRRFTRQISHPYLITALRRV